jgi:hypothetical protein
MRHYISISQNNADKDSITDISSILPENNSPEEWDSEAAEEIKVQIYLILPSTKKMMVAVIICL